MFGWTVPATKHITITKLTRFVYIAQTLRLRPAIRGVSAVRSAFSTSIVSCAMIACHVKSYYSIA